MNRTQDLISNQVPGNFKRSRIREELLKMQHFPVSGPVRGKNGDKGDKILLYTDGITEAHDQKKDRFGLEKLLSTLKKHGQRSNQDLIQAIKDGVFAFMGPISQYDDITPVKMEKQ